MRNYNCSTLNLCIKVPGIISSQLESSISNNVSSEKWGGNVAKESSVIGKPVTHLPVNWSPPSPIVY